MMTDTDILDYLQNSYTLSKRSPMDVQIGSVVFTIGLKPGTIRELICAAIEEDRRRTAFKVARAIQAR